MLARNILSRGTHKAPLGRRSMGFFSREGARDIQTGAAALTVITTFAMAGIGTVRFIFERNKKWNDDYSEFSNLLRIADDEMDMETKGVLEAKMRKEMEKIEKARREEAGVDFGEIPKVKVDKNLLRAQMFAQYCDDRQLSSCRTHKSFCLAANRLRTHARQKLNSFMYSKDSFGVFWNPLRLWLSETTVVEMRNVYCASAPLDAANHLLHNKYDEMKGALCQKIINDYLLVDYAMITFVNVLADDMPSLGFLNFLSQNTKFTRKGSVKRLLKGMEAAFPSEDVGDENTIVVRKNPKIVMVGGKIVKRSGNGKGKQGNGGTSESSKTSMGVFALLSSWFTRHDLEQYGWKVHNNHAKEDFSLVASNIRAMHTYAFAHARVPDDEVKAFVSKLRKDNVHSLPDVLCRMYNSVTGKRS